MTNQTTKYNQLQYQAVWPLFTHQAMLLAKTLQYFD